MCPVSRGAFFGIRVPRLKNENHDAAAVRRCTFAFVMHGFAFGNHNQTSAHGAGRCEVGELPGLELPSSVLGGLNRYVTHLFDHIASDGRRIPLQHVHRHIEDRHSPDGEASMQTRETQAFLFPTERGA